MKQSEIYGGRNMTTYRYEFMANQVTNEKVVRIFSSKTFSGYKIFKCTVYSKPYYCDYELSEVNWFTGSTLIVFKKLSEIEMKKIWERIEKEYCQIWRWNN